LVLGGKRVWQTHFAISLSEVCLMQSLHFGEMALEGILDAPRQHCHAILLTLTTAYDDLMIGKIDIFHTQAETLHQWVEAATGRWSARWVRKARISSAPMSLG
jgi:hypothetical protein